ncbi:MAG TPA: hypothetical protein VFQ85_00530 [Mycobacteriales bacterium]|jgi:hypothetical protein|nr:hypothetical protein [Mycobacteriales bacterium]
MSRPAATLALVALLAAGCSHGEKAGSLPSVSPAPVTTTAAATPSATATAGPDAITTAVRRYFATVAEAGRTGDVAALNLLIAPRCTCRAQLEYLRREAAAGHRLTTLYTVEAVRPHDVTATTAGATVTFSTTAGSVVDRSGAVVRAIPALRHVGVELGLQRVGQTWLLARVAKVGG